MAAEMRDWADKMDSLGYHERAQHYRDEANRDEAAGLIPHNLKTKQERSARAVLREQELNKREAEMIGVAHQIRQRFGTNFTSDFSLKHIFGRENRTTLYSEWLSVINSLELAPGEKIIISNLVHTINDSRLETVGDIRNSSVKDLKKIRGIGRVGASFIKTIFISDEESTN